MSGGPYQSLPCKSAGTPAAPGQSVVQGYGIGLPLSRLYARYFGGTLKLVSLPGYGTSVDLFLRRVNSNQVEIVPDNDN